MREHDRAGTEVVDGLRGLAIVLVFVFHLWTYAIAVPPAPWNAFVQTGYLGVELFFAISGFCLFYPYARHALESGTKPTLRQYAYRRFIKILPSYALAIVATLVVALPYFIDKRTVFIPLATHLLLINNWFTDPLGQINGVFWSLGVEVQFYLLFPFFAPLFARFPFASLGASIAVGLAYRYGFAATVLHDPVVHQVPAYLDVFAFGMFAAYAVVFVRLRPPLRRQSSLCTLLALAALAGIMALQLSANAQIFDPVGRLIWNLPHRTMLAACFALLITASCLAANWWQRLVANPMLVFLSILSYNLYLWHCLVMTFLVIHGLRPNDYADAHAPDGWKPLFIAASIVLSLGVSALVTYFVERPLLATVRPQWFAFRLPG